MTMFQYFLKVVATQFRTIDGKVVNTHQYQVTHYNRDASTPQDQTKQGVNVMHGMAGVPGAFFNYEISPIKVIHEETRQSFAHFLTSCVVFIHACPVATISLG